MSMNNVCSDPTRDVGSAVTYSKKRLWIQLDPDQAKVLYEDG